VGVVVHADVVMAASLSSAHVSLDVASTAVQCACMDQLVPSVSSLLLPSSSWTPAWTWTWAWASPYG